MAGSEPSKRADWKPDWAKLRPELLESVSKFLSPEALANASLACRSWSSSIRGTCTRLTLTHAAVAAAPQQPALDLSKLRSALPFASSCSYYVNAAALPQVLSAGLASLSALRLTELEVHDAVFYNLPWSYSGLRCAAFGLQNYNGTQRKTEAKFSTSLVGNA